ncbi:protein translocase subunit SecD [Temperatibacter marinus]|uniref:Protein translocase subunit SecD n=1 Tax=Temperatibacter marinus TaxID=1456591 RepID=A0AA52HAH9_9PROT|nr:protein translocase subunit SecD [Temperatibacter marinus]WND02618.1 protein translocase subunit SecD [Temperatibacter marinus]
MLEFSRFKIFMILAVVVFGLATALPNFLSENQRASLPDFMPKDSLALGLDLQGGVYLLMEVDKTDVVEMRMQAMFGNAKRLRSDRSSIDEEFASAIAAERNSSRVETDIRNSRFIKSVRKVRETLVIEVRDVKDETLQEQYMSQAKRIFRPLVQSGNIDGLGNQIEEVDVVEEGRRLSYSLTEVGVKLQQQDAVSRTINVMRKRIDPTGTKEITLAPQGDNRIVLQVPGENDVERLKRVILKAAKLTFHAVAENVSQVDIQAGRIPAGVMVVPMREGGAIAVYTDTIVSGTDLESAKADFDEYGRPAVGFSFNGAGARAFGSHTQSNIGKLFAIKLDDEIISAPRIQTAILGGSGRITGVGTVEESQDLATLLNAGSLPVDITIAMANVVSASLGEDSVQAGKFAAVAGFVGVIVFMLISYGRFGLAANVGLIINLILIAGALSLFQATLTLPGIAGIVLTIGMAVDANVLIFERIREEQKTGKKPYTAMESGYGQALSTIMDANITTFIAAAILYVLGTGPVQGFAVTLSIGILTSIFTAVVLTRLILASWLKRTQPTQLPL